MATVQAEIIDADITRLFEEKGQSASPNDLDLRIVSAAAQAVRSTSSGLSEETTNKRSRSPILVITAVVLILAMLYPVVRSFQNLPTTVQDSARILSK